MAASYHWGTGAARGGPAPTCAACGVPRAGTYPKPLEMSTMIGWSNGITVPSAGSQLRTVGAVLSRSSDGR